MCKKDCVSINGSKCDNSNGRIFFPHSDSPPISHLMAFMKKLRINELFSQFVQDPRKVNQIQYDLSAVFMYALAVPLFRLESKNMLDSQTKDSPNIIKNIAKFSGMNCEKLPAIKSIDDLFAKIDYNQLNEVLLGCFDQLIKSKLFSNHKKLCPLGYYPLALDGEVIHKYDPHHQHVKKGKCPHCLKRTRGDTVWYLHMNLVVSLVTPCGLKIPIYVYPIHGKSLENKITCSDDVHKQECEKQAFIVVLKKIREVFPKLKIMLLLDSLYANNTTIELAEKHRCAFMSVRKKGCMKTFGNTCDDLLKLDSYRAKHENKRKQKNDKGQLIEQTSQFFNEVKYQDKKIHALRFEETITNKFGEKVSGCYWEWITNVKLSKKRCFEMAATGRLRWEEEDIFNSLENRGFNIRHDYSRNWKAQMVWVLLLLIAFAITQCFVLSNNVKKMLKDKPIKNFMKDLFYQIKYLTAVVIFEASVLKNRVQFRYSFDSS